MNRKCKLLDGWNYDFLPKVKHEALSSMDTECRTRQPWLKLCWKADVIRSTTKKLYMFDRNVQVGYILSVTFFFTLVLFQIQIRDRDYDLARYQSFARKYYILRALLCVKQSFAFINSLLIIALVRPVREFICHTLGLILARAYYVSRLLETWTSSTMNHSTHALLITFPPLFHPLKLCNQPKFLQNLR